MAHQNDSGAGDARQGDTLDDAAAAFDSYFEEQGEEPVDDEDQAGDEPADETDADERDDEPSDDADEDGEQDNEPEQPAIEAPASLNAQERAAFAAASPEAQRAWAAAETRRNADVQTATTRAAEAQRAAEAAAASAETEARRRYADQVRHIADAYAPRQPNPADYGQDMASYQRDHAHWQYASAQHQQLMQQVDGIEAQVSQAEQSQVQQWKSDQRRILTERFPEYITDESVRPPLFETAKLLGYGDDNISQASAIDILGMKRATEWRLKAEKLDAINARKMVPVRAGKTVKPNSAQPKGSAQAARLSDSMNRLKQSGDVNDAAAAFRALDRRR